MNTPLASIKQTFGQALKAARERQHVSVADQCRALGVPRPTYEAWEADTDIPNGGLVGRLIAWDRSLSRFRDELRTRRGGEGTTNPPEAAELPPGPAITEVPSVFKKLKQRVRRQSAAEIDTKALRQLLGVPPDAKLLVKCDGVEDMELGKDVTLHAAWETVDDE